MFVRKSDYLFVYFSFLNCPSLRSYGQILLVYVPSTFVSRSRPAKDPVEPSEDPDSDEDDEEFVSSKSQVLVYQVIIQGCLDSDCLS